MPSNHLLLYFARDFAIEKHWLVNGRHYAQTSEHWLQNMDAKKAEIMPIFEQVYGSQALKFWSYWRIFFLAVAELFGQFDGEEWMVNHYLFTKK
ncbi:MAG: SAM-dependent methyltransferase, partial [Leptospiraceae bacterium]|nr:SAM-dependent methyltransferase [Leptospiraceae bacterium]